MNWVTSLKDYIPYNEQEKKDKQLIENCINTFDDVLTRNNIIAHITSSGFVVNKTKDKVLMVHHNIYNSWSWTGGHADGEEDLLLVAIKEASEETGVKNINPISSQIFSLDILPVIGHFKKGHYISSHLHLSMAYLLVADENEPLVIKIDENSAVKWVPIDEINIYSNEPQMHLVYEKIICKIKMLQ
jgi:8-oxo-dGTP pyrophosphatase MutT (NUDIX family)